MPEQFTNQATTTLNGAINNSTTTLVVNSASNFPTSGNFALVIENEILTVTAVSGVTFTVSRGQEGTTAASHADGVDVTHSLTVRSLNQREADNISEGGSASRPASSKAGRLYICDDSPYLYYDTGSAWICFGPIFKLYPPVLGSFTWVNQGSATATQNTNGSIYLSCPSDGGSTNLHILKKTLALGTPYKVTVCFILLPNDQNYSMCGLILRESGSGKCQGFNLRNDSADLNFQIEDYANTSTTAGSEIGPSAARGITSQYIWLQVEDDGTHKTFRWSRDGLHFVDYLQMTRTTYITADEVGVYLYPYNKVTAFNWLSFKEE